MAGYRSLVYWRAAMLLPACLVLAAAAARTPGRVLAGGRISLAAWPYLPGSIIPLRVVGFPAPYRAAVVGPGRFLPDGLYQIPQDTPPGRAVLVAGNAAGLAQATVRIAPPPRAGRALLVVASYDDGLVLHDAGNFSVLGVLATGGSPADVAIGPGGRIAAADTRGTTLTLARLTPWSVSQVDGVALGDAVAFDRRTGAIFVSDREGQGGGGLTRVSAGARITRVATGATPEGLAVDQRRQIVYVANANDASVAVVDAVSMRVLRRFHAVSRIFSLALSPDGDRLYGISNQSDDSPFDAPGSAVALALNGSRPRVVARSPNLAFPVGITLDSATHTVFVTDEARDEIDVLDELSLRPKRPPLRTCAIPWTPSLDAAADRLYVPCAGGNAVDVFDARTLRRVRGAPFATGGYPLAVAIWRPGE